MPYFAVCTFDLKNATRDDYVNAYADLTNLGLYHALTANNSMKITLPTTTVAGQFNGQSAASVRDDVMAKVQRAFTARRFKSEIFVSVGGTDWGWSHQTT